MATATPASRRAWTTTLASPSASTSCSWRSRGRRRAPPADPGSGAAVAGCDECRLHLGPGGLDRVELRQHGLQITARGCGLRLLGERGERRRAERAGVRLERMSRTSRGLCVSGRRCVPKSVELARCILQELVDELGEERLVATHALA